MTMKLLEWWPCFALTTRAGAQEAWFAPTGGSNSRIESAKSIFRTERFTGAQVDHSDPNSGFMLHTNVHTSLRTHLSLILPRLSYKIFGRD